ncbi:hypothetical protein RAY_134 [Erwinia phage vB_EamM_RAY]|uniref:Uncharacterized protein n=2 Tax=Agricanvirus TaxID=1984776 RepID=A0A173GEG8_9CAUD|nr:hypothetical protein FDH98_gp134 [Erwinia phage vB_EamM_RAY]YP_009605921.1 hypothetical protein FDH99_gp137 [Erwinia phage vB_EamM_Simmy50]ANH51599.1 hypothetical protein SIMMY50_137 [Erwinia phage vB_EamM_Simmy50]ANH51915.1 hypothetical protein RAY_134 [Erwinia phage vB_EamM_RAY]
MSALLTELLSGPAIPFGLVIGILVWLLHVKLSNKSHQHVYDVVGHQLVNDIEHLCRELASPSDHRRYIKTDLPPQGDQINYLRKHIESHLKARVTKYIDAACYNDRTARRPRAKLHVKVVNLAHMGQGLEISFKLGRGIFTDHRTYFKPSTYAHVSLFFKDEVLSK